jgi:hypothetical protein
LLCLFLDRSLQHVRWCGMTSYWSGEHSRGELLVGHLYRAFDRIRSRSSMRSVQIFQGKEPMVHEPVLLLLQEVATRCKCWQVKKLNPRARATPNNTGCGTRSRIHRLGSTGSTSDFGISVSLGISPTTSTSTAWIPPSDGKVLHQPQTSLASADQHQTGGRSDRRLLWRACSAEMGRPRYVGASYTQ